MSANQAGWDPRKGGGMAHFWASVLIVLLLLIIVLLERHPRAL